ncbi:MAG: T9SS type A sorting domain-containing protein [Bacteroidia bacterium]|jgi:hypothetical protein
MKKLLLAVAFFTAVQVFAQKDIMITMNTPVANQTIYANTQFNITFTIKNNGTIDIPASDSIQVGIIINNSLVSAATLSHNVIAAGQSVNAAFNNYSLTFSQGASNVDFCLMALLRYNGNLDSNTANNVSCAKVNLSTAVGIDELGIANTVKVYPNPAVQFINFEYDYNNASVIHVMDITGKRVKSVQVASGVASMDISDLNNGIYMYEIRTTENALIKSGKFNIAH